MRIALVLSMVLLAGAACMGCDSVAGAEAKSSIVCYKTQDGKTVFVDSLEKVPAEYRDAVSTELRAITKVPSRTYSDEPAHDKEVRVYRTSWCHYCKTLERELSGAGVRYTAIDIEKSRPGMNEFKRIGGSAVPLVTVGGKEVDSSVDSIKAAFQ